MPVDLRLARGQRREPAAVPHGFPRRHFPGAQYGSSGAAAVHELPQFGRVLDAAAVIQQDLRRRRRTAAAGVRAGSRRAGDGDGGAVETALDEPTGSRHRSPGYSRPGEPSPGPPRETYKPSDIAVLCRKRAQFVSLRKAIEARGIPVEVVGSAACSSCRSTGRGGDAAGTAHAGASDALARLLTGPRWRIGPRDLVALGGGPGNWSGRDHGSAGNSRPARRGITDLTAETGSLVEHWTTSANQTLTQRPGIRDSARWPMSCARCGSERKAARRPGRGGGAGTRAGHRGSGPARRGSGSRARRPGRVHRRRVCVHCEGAEPTLGAFLAYLTAAQQEEFGLETAGSASRTRSSCSPCTRRRGSSGRPCSCQGSRRVPSRRCSRPGRGCRRSGRTTRG